MERAVFAFLSVEAIMLVSFHAMWGQGFNSVSNPPESPPFRIPFDLPAGPDTWYISQFYGNTRFAFEYGDRWYQAGQGLHFGLDFEANCGTPVVAIGDGRVIGVDNRQHGAGPHNLIIQHGQQGVVSLYGHLLKRPALSIGERVSEGQVIALVGDPDLTCTSRPHLHLEIRNFGRGTAYNPVDYIQADWDNLAIIGLDEGFQQDLHNPRRWANPHDQPVIDMWGPILNNYRDPWPPDWNFR